MLDERQSALRERIVGLHPELAGEQFQTLGNGENNDLLLVGGIVFRLRRYPDQGGSAPREAAILRAIQPHLPIPVPLPIDVAPDLLSYRQLAGEPLPRGRIAEADLSWVAARLAEFLRQLHRAPIPEELAGELRAYQPIEPWQHLYERARVSVYPLLSPTARQHVDRHFHAFFARSEGVPLTPSLIHGDFGAGNILWEPERRELTGVIDFSSAGAGDPAIDFAAASTIAPDILARMAESDPAIQFVQERIEFYLGTFLLQEAVFGAESGDREALAAGLEGVERQAR